MRYLIIVFNLLLLGCTQENFNLDSQLIGDWKLEKKYSNGQVKYFSSGNILTFEKNANLRSNSYCEGSYNTNNSILTLKWPCNNFNSSNWVCGNDISKSTFNYNTDYKYEISENTLKIYSIESDNFYTLYVRL